MNLVGQINERRKEDLRFIGEPDRLNDYNGQNCRFIYTIMLANDI